MKKTNITIELLIKKLNLSPHIEGGFAGISYQDEGIIKKDSLPPEYEGPRTYGNAIHFLLPFKTKSICHRIRMNELWHFYLGDPLELFHISPEGKLFNITLGQDIINNQKITYVVPKMHWVGAIPKGPNFSLVGCSTAPGFELSDWKKGDRNLLIKTFPHLKKIIIKLT